MKKSGSIIEAAAGAVIFVIGLVLCFHNYVQKGNTAYAVSLLVAIAGVIVLIAGICNIVSKGERKPVDTKVLAQAALCAALCYVGATFIKIDVPVGTEKTMFHFGNVFCVLAALLIGGAWGGLARSSRYDNQRFDNGVCNERTKDLYFKALYRSDCRICST